MLVTLGTKQHLDALASGTKALLGSDSLLDLRVAGRSIAENPHGPPGLGAWLRQQLGLGPAAPLWVLVGRGGRGLVSGTTLPEPEVLARALEMAGERNPVAVLEAFLRDHPDHAEARRDLVRALRFRLQARLQEHPATGGQVLSSKTDLRVWGAVARELDLLLQGEDWVSLQLNLDRDLPASGDPERLSPLMMSLYRRHRSRVVAALQRYPENPAGWSNLLRMDRVLGEHTLVRVLERIAWFQGHPADAAMLPWGPLAQRIHREARSQGDWRQAAEGLRILWRQSAKPKLNLLGPGSPSLSAADAAVMAHWCQSEREKIWKQLFEPLVEALVRAGCEAEVAPLLGELDEAWAQMGLDGRVRTLARAMGRSDLAQAWIAAIRRPSPMLAREGMMGYDLTIIHQNPKEGSALEPWCYDQIFCKHGLSVGLQTAPISWVKRLGWRDPMPRWAMLDAHWTVILQGETLPKGEELMAAYRALGLPGPLDRVEAFRKEHPDHLGALASEAGFLGTIARAHRSERRGGCAPGPAQEPPGRAEKAAWQAYFAVLEHLLEDPMGTCPEPLRRAQVRVPAPTEFGDDGESLGIKSLSGRILPRLEAELSRRPSDKDLWRIWLAFAAHLDRPLTPLLDTLAPSPVSPSLSWPPEDLLALAAEGLARQHRWRDLVDLLQPRREARMAMVEHFLRTRKLEGDQGYHLAWGWELTRPLLEAMLRLGRSREADEIMGSLAKAGHCPGLLEMRSLSEMAKEMGDDSWARKWSPGPPNPD